jgi:hypothetical protein
VGAVLLSLSDGNWRMGDRMSIAQSNFGPGDEQIVNEHFMLNCTGISTMYISYLHFSIDIINCVLCDQIP